MLDLIFSAKIINIIGLSFDLVGVIFIAISFKHVRREQEPIYRSWTNYNHDKEQASRDKENKYFSKLDNIGVFLLIIGFALQIMSNFLK
jgi:predicted tellurium resistance membrane protein TerC